LEPERFRVLRLEIAVEHGDTGVHELLCDLGALFRRVVVMRGG
jgi:hypothetical protein